MVVSHNGFAFSGGPAKKLLRRITTAIVIALIPGLVAGQSRGITIIGNDRGGLVGERAQVVDSLRASGQRIEIRGTLCYSACTMYLGAGDVCVSPQTTFGFHGPSRNGTPLSPDRFEHWSLVMARYYNEPLRQWFMAEGRYAQQDVYRLSGQQLIDLGYAQC
jgi:hypothetical protein